MKKTSLFLLFALAFSLPCVAQQEEEGPVQSGVQSRMVIASDDGSGAMPQVAIMSAGDGQGDMFFSTAVDFAPGLPGMMGAPDIFSLAQNNGVQKEIELVDEQIDQLKEINADYAKRIQEKIKSMQGENGQLNLGRAKDLSQLIQDLNKEKNERMEGVFLPHQFERLRQISLQTQMRRSGESSMLSNQRVVEALGLTEEQQKNLKDKAEELKKEMQEKIEELKEEAREELFGELTRDQRKKLKEMLGNDFELKTPNFRDRIREMRSRKDGEEEDKN